MNKYKYTSHQRAGLLQPYRLVLLTGNPTPHTDRRGPATSQGVGSPLLALFSLIALGFCPICASAVVGAFTLLNAGVIFGGQDQVLSMNVRVNKTFLVKPSNVVT